MNQHGYYFLLIFFAGTNLRLNCMEEVEWKEHILTNTINFTASNNARTQHYLLENLLGMSVKEAAEKTSLLSEELGDSEELHKVINSTRYPFCSIGYIETEFSGDGILPHSSTGSLIGPQHVLTSAHSVFKKAVNYAGHFRINFGMNSYKEYKEGDNWIRAVRIYVPQGYIANIDNLEERKKFDIAVAVLEKPVGLKRGWFSCFFSEDTYLLLNKNITITGYPCDKGEGDDEGMQMWSMNGLTRKRETDRVYYDIVTAPNQSGSPIWLNMLKNGNKLCPIVLGVHTHGEVPGKLFGRYWRTQRSGTRITEQKFRQIMHIIAHTLEFVCTIPAIMPEAPRTKSEFLKLISKPVHNEDELGLEDTPPKALTETERLSKRAPQPSDFFEQQDSSSSYASDEIMAQYDW